MSPFLTRVRNLSQWSKRRNQSRAVPNASSHGNANFMHHIDRKIHPDLESLLEQEPNVQVDQDNVLESTLTSTHTQLSTSPNFTALTSSTRRRSSDTNVLTTANAIDGVQQVDQSLSSSNASNMTGQNISGETFGRKRSAHRGPKKVSPTTPGSQRSRNANSEAQTSSLITTPGSPSELSHNGRSRGNTVSSSNTFGVPSPGFTAMPRKPSTSSTELPPLPPLDHPAFKTAAVVKRNSLLRRQAPVPAISPSESDEMGGSKVTRHSHSLPSLSNLKRAPSNYSRQRARTGSRSKPYEFFSEAKSSTPLSNRRSRTHKRTTSNVSQSSSRRASAEFSAEQASSVSHGSGLGSSWEVQVSREMVRMSLGDSWRGTDQTAAGGGALSQLGQERGNRYHTTGIPALGSPFLYQDARTHHTSPAKHCRITSGPPYQVTTGISNRKIIPSTMTKDTSRRSSPAAKSHTPERSRTPAPPAKINTVAFATAGAPSSSYLAPPALSFTAATPDVSPISPILRPAHTSLTGPTNAVLRVPSTPPAERPVSSHSSKGKRKADEAGVEGGGTPPKEGKETRATFAVEPRPHRASANSNSTRSAAPSSYHRKRARLSTTPESRPGSRTSTDNQAQTQNQNQNAATTGSWSSKTSKNSGFASSPHHQPRAIPPSYQPSDRAPSRRSISQASVPISALISPHAPSISRSATFHMRDPRKPAPIQSTPWSLSFPAGRAEPGEGWRGWVDRGGSPLHAWFFFVGFLLFPLWWVASFVGIRETRRLEAGLQEKGVILDDPQVEYDTRSWRTRCRVMAVISLVTYIPFIVCVAIFA